MKVKVMIEDGVKPPTRAHKQDAGADLYSPRSITIDPHSSAVIDTGVHIAIPYGLCGLLVSKSGLNVNHDITSTGLIDAGYTGSVRVKLYNQGNTPYHVSEGDKISQIVILPVVLCDFIQVDEFEATERGSGGFGSSGR